jgi:long-subunit fatty acid transport protein
VRTAERADADPDVNDPDEIVGDDSGRVFAVGDRQRFWIMPQWSYNFSEKSSIAAAIRYTDVDYRDTFPGTHTPFTDARFEASLTRGFSTRTRGYIRATVGRIENEFELIGFTSEVDGRGLSVGIERGLTQTTRFRAEVGVAETEVNGGDSDTDPVWDVNLVRNLETITLLAQVRRSVNSDGNGRVTLRDSFNLSVKKQFSERFDGGLGVRAYTTDQLSSDPGTFEDRDYIQLRAQLGYALTRTFLVEAAYSYTRLDRSTVAEDADSNSIIFWLTWQPTAR